MAEQHITWTRIEEHAFPMVVRMARERGIDTEGWGLVPGVSGRTFARVENHAPRTQFQFLASAREADAFFSGMRFSMQQTDEAAKGS